MSSDCNMIYDDIEVKIGQSGNKVIDESTHDHDQMKFVSYDQFKDVEHIAEGEFSKIYDKEKAVIGDLGINKSATESTDDNESYSIILYIAPEIFQGQKYTTASDVYSFGMIMWKILTGRRPFWNRIHNAELIIEIRDGLRPPINNAKAPEGYIKLMEECWHLDPKKRPSAIEIFEKIKEIFNYKRNNCNPTIIIGSDIGPVEINHPGAIYTSRPLSSMIQSAMSERSLRSQSINSETDPFHHNNTNNMIYNGKRKFGDDLIVDNNNKVQRIKRSKLLENENYNDYRSKEAEFDINRSYDNDEYTSDET